MLSINTNISSLITQRSLNKSTDALNQAIERMTTGFKINHAKDNAANYAIATDMTTKLNSLQVAEENTAMGLDLVNTASEVLDILNDRVERLRALQEQSNNGTYGEVSLNAINKECTALVDEIVRVTDDEAVEMAKLVAKTEGLSVGISGGAAICGAIKIAKRESFTNKRLVVILPDSVERYLSTGIF